jgi:hypothetical protein
MLLQAYKTSQYVVLRGGSFLGNGAAFSQEGPTAKRMSNQPAL